MDSQPTEQRPLLGIGLKLISVMVFVVMATLIKLAGEFPVGELVFFRSLFGAVPIIVFLAVRGHLLEHLSTERPMAHLRRAFSGTITMMLMFAGLTLLPLAEATTIGYASPFIVVILSAIILKETVRLYRWSAVVVGFAGVVIVAWPNLEFLQNQNSIDTAHLLGFLLAFAGAFGVAITILAVRDLVATERSGTVVLFFSLTASLFALVSLPVGLWIGGGWQWVMPDPLQWVILISIGLTGGVGQILVTDAYRYADISVIAPLEYASLLAAVAVGYFIFGDVPTWFTLVGGAIIVAAGIFIIMREHRLGIERAKSKRVSTPHG